MSETSVGKSVPLVFVYTGNPLPRYALKNLRHASRRYDGGVTLLTDHPERVAGVSVIDIRNWYVPSAFLEFCKESPLDPFFRGGFWLRAAERFFVLQQFMCHFGVEKLLQAEIDVLVLDTNDLPNKLDSFGNGIFAPMESQSRAIASLVYINSRSALDKLCSFLIDNASLGNEMAILGKFIETHPSHAHSLVSDQVFNSRIWPIAPSTVPSDTGITDATALGMWLFGWDPRNSDYSMWNHRQQSLTEHDMGQLRFRFNPLTWKLTVRADGGHIFGVRCLHIHSKIFGRVTNRWALWMLVILGNRPNRTLISIKKGSWLSWLIRAILARRFMLMRSSLPAPTKSFLGKALFRLSLISPRELSNRERQAIISMLPKPRATTDGPPVGLIILVSDSNPNDIDATLASVTRSSHLFSGVTIASAQSKARNGFAQSCAGTPINVVNSKELVRSKLGNTVPDESLNEVVAALLGFDENVDTTVICRAGVSFPDDLYLADSRGRVLLNLSAKKNTNAMRHVIDFFPGVSRQWSMERELFVVQSSIVRAMFLNDLGRIREWQLASEATPDRELSFADSYGAWVLSHARNSVIVGRY